MFSKKISRRKALENSVQLSGMSLFSTSSLTELVDCIIQNLIRDAAAEESGQRVPLNYVNIGMLGAPLRYQFDHWLRTNDKDPSSLFSLITGSHFKFANQKISGIEQSSYKYKGMILPHLFSQSVSTTSGETNISDLLPHMAVIRGYGTGVDGHPTNFIRQHSPVGGLSSISAVAADQGKRIFDVIQWPNRTGWSNYFSKSGKTNTVLFGSDPAKSLLEGFTAPPDNLSSTKKLIERNTEIVDLAKRRLAFYIKSDLPGSKTIAKNHANAIAMIKKGIGNLNDFWTPAVERYTTVIANAVRKIDVPGISDSSLTFSDTQTWDNHFVELNEAQRANLWKLGSGADIHLQKDSDLRQAVRTANILDLAKGLALAEYVLSENLGTAIEILSGPLEKLQLNLADGTTKADFQHDHDMHATAAPVAIFLMNQFYRGIAAGLLEFSHKLKNKTENGKSIWSKTAIQITSDFDRSARADGSGSDHGFNQMVSSVIGGHISNGPHVLGNIYIGDKTGSYGGTQGIAAPIADYNQSGPPTPVMMTSTVCSILQVENNPYVNVAEPLCDVENGELKTSRPGKILVSE